MMIYQKLFAEYNQVAGQVLMTKNTMVNPVSRENAKNTFDELFRLGADPDWTMKMTRYLLRDAVW